MQRLTLVTSDEVSKALGCSKRHLSNLCDRRLLPFYKLGRLKRFDLEDVKHALEKLHIEQRS
jgi:excisionase family DNA binding protein